jgi:hypothetical protein
VGTFDAILEEWKSPAFAGLFFSGFKGMAGQEFWVVRAFVNDNILVASFLRTSLRPSAER